MTNDDKTKKKKKTVDKSKKRKHEEIDSDDNEMIEPLKKKQRRSKSLDLSPLILNDKEDIDLEKPRPILRIIDLIEEKCTLRNKTIRSIDDFFTFFLQDLPPIPPQTRRIKNIEEIEEIVEEEIEEIVEEEYIDNMDIEKLKTLNGLLELIEKYKDINNKDITVLISLKDELEELNSLVGMKDIKDIVSSQIIFLIQKFSKDEMMHTVIQGPPGCGKCNTKDTPIIMFDGTIKMVQDIKVGELLMGDDSTSRKVLSLARGEDELYEVINVKGDKYGCNSEHILCLKKSNWLIIKNRKNKKTYQVIWFNSNERKNNYKTFSYKNKNQEKVLEEATIFSKTINKNNEYITISIKEYLKLPKYIKDKLKGYKVGIEFNEKQLEFDPYIIGFWLGDGTKRTSEITNQEAVCLKYIKEKVKEYDCYLQHKEKYTYRINGLYNKDIKYNSRRNYFLEQLKKLNLLNNKHIPYIYKCNSRENRLKLLAGLIDSDGYIYNNVYDITQKNNQLSEDIIYLCRSLGFACYSKKVKKYCIYKNEKIYGEYNKITIYGKGLEEIPVLCLRKQASIRKQNKDALVSGITVKSIGKGNYYGFELDGNHKYLLGNFIVTHNTTLAKILGKIYLKLGYLNNKKITIAKRSDLIAGYLGQTAMKTQKVIDESRGGVLIIDEVYSLGNNNENGDSFSKECIDTLNQNLSENPDFICIIMGYKEDIQKCFFSKNQGLKRRFPWVYDIEDVTSNQLKHIFISMVRKNDWDINIEEIPNNFFKYNRVCFPYNGGSIQTFFTKVKMVHSKRVFGKDKSEKMNIIREDIKKAMEIQKEFKNTDEGNDKIPFFYT